MKEYYYYLRNGESRPVMTICLLTSDDGVDVGRGVSICSLCDTFCKRVGRAKARGRAVQALVRKATGNPVTRAEAWAVAVTIRPCGAREGLLLDAGKYTFNPRLTDLERGLIGSEEFKERIGST